MAFVDDQMAVLPDKRIHSVLAIEALNRSDIDLTGRPTFSPADHADLARLNIQKCENLVLPLFNQNPAVDEDQGVGMSVREHA